MGGSKYEGNIDMLTPEQKQFLSNIFGGTGAAGEAMGQFLKPYSPEAYQDVFNKAVVDPTMMQYQRKVLPSINQQYVDANAGSSSALNQALAQSATDLGTTLGGAYGQFFQNQQANTLNALGQMGGLATQKTFSPLISQQSGWLGPTIGALGQIGGGWAFSSETVKENVRDYKKGLDLLKHVDVKIYDYVQKVGGMKDRVGVISEALPDELCGNVQGIRSVDLYGLIGVLINSVKELRDKIERLETKK